MLVPCLPVQRHGIQNKTRSSVRGSVSADCYARHRNDIARHEMSMKMRMSARPANCLSGPRRNRRLRYLSLGCRGELRCSPTSTILHSLHTSGLFGTMGRCASERLNKSLQFPRTAVPLHPLSGRVGKRRQLAAQAVNTEPSSKHTSTIGLLDRCAHTTVQKTSARDRESQSRLLTGQQPSVQLQETRHTPAPPTSATHSLLAKGCSTPSLVTDYVLHPKRKWLGAVLLRLLRPPI